jgi:hypothetical protein
MTKREDVDRASTKSGSNAKVPVSDWAMQSLSKVSRTGDT